MRTTRVFKSGNSLAVRIPKDFELHGSTVEIFKRGNEVIIREIPVNLTEAFDLFANLPKDFFKERREDHTPQKRESF